MTFVNETVTLRGRSVMESTCCCTRTLSPEDEDLHRYTKQSITKATVEIVLLKTIFLFVVLSSSLTQCLDVVGVAVNLNRGLSRHGVRFRWLALLQDVFRCKVWFSFTSNYMMGSVRTFDSATTLTVCEGYDVTKQEHYFKKKCNCCDCFHKRCTFRVWQVLLFLFIVAVVIAGLALIISMMDTGKIATKHSASTGTDCPDNRGKQIEFSCLEAHAWCSSSAVVTKYNFDLVATIIVYQNTNNY